MSLGRILFSFEGRINRAPYWFVILTLIAISVSVQIVSFQNPEVFESNLTIIAYLAIIWPALAVQAKRWHDIDYSGWWILINFVPIIGPVCSLVANGFRPGTEGANRFGYNPLATPEQST
jgi:uncharacterized membrane protein YhaH (DUF805 family)